MLPRLLRIVLGRLVGPREACVGARPRWTFRHPILNGDGVGSLADLEGKPLLIRFIGFG